MQPFLPQDKIISIQKEPAVIAVWWLKLTPVQYWWLWD